MASHEDSHPDLLIMYPRSGKHAQTFVMLHGRGSNAKAFGPDLLDSDLPGLGKLQDLFPKAKFVFPTAARRPLKRFKNSLMVQWFDCWAVDRPYEQYELQLEGLKESTLYIHAILRDEVTALGGKNVVLWGISAGCATSLIASLLWNGDSLGAVVGMCGYLPLLEQMRTTPSAEILLINRAVECLRKELHFTTVTSETSSSILDTPIFFGHGTEDNQVPLHLAHDAEKFLRNLGIRTKLSEYEGLGHWYVEIMLKHIVEFLACKAGWPVNAPSDAGLGV